MDVYVSDIRALLGRRPSPVDTSDLIKYQEQLKHQVERAEKFFDAIQPMVSALEEATDFSGPALARPLKIRIENERNTGTFASRLSEEVRDTGSKNLFLIEGYVEKADLYNEIASSKRESVSPFNLLLDEVVRQAGKDTSGLRVILPDYAAGHADLARKLLPDDANVVSIADLKKDRGTDEGDTTVYCLLDDTPFLLPSRFGESDQYVLFIERMFDDVEAMYQAGLRTFEFFMEPVRWDDDLLAGVAERELTSEKVSSLPTRPEGDVNTSGMTPRDDLFLGAPHISQRVRHTFEMQNNLRDFVGRHQGRRAFVLGNGPSLNKVDMSLLKDEITFGANQIHLGFQKWGWETDYWAITDRLQIEKYSSSFSKALSNSEFMKFVPASTVHLFDFKPETTCPIHHNFITPEGDPEFSLDPTIVNSGKSVVFVMAQLAAVMGCTDIVFLGVDHSYGVPAARQQSNLNIRVADRLLDSNPRARMRSIPVWGEKDTTADTHFDPRYIQNRVFHAPDMDKLALCLGAAADQARQRGISIRNASPGTKLTTVPTVDFDSLF